MKYSLYFSVFKNGFCFFAKAAYSLSQRKRFLRMQQPRSAFFFAFVFLLFFQIFKSNSDCLNNKCRESAVFAGYGAFHFLYNIIRKPNTLIRCWRNRRDFKFFHTITSYTKVLYIKKYMKYALQMYCNIVWIMVQYGKINRNVNSYYSVYKSHPKNYRRLFLQAAVIHIYAVLCLFGCLFLFFLCAFAL